MYPEPMIQPMRQDLTRYGIEETRTAADVDKAVQQGGTVMIVVNSVCGCAAGKMRPAVGRAMQHSNLPDKSVTVFAGQDREATEKARAYFTGFAPSSPSIGLLRDGKLVYMMERYQIEGKGPEQIADELKRAFDQCCSAATTAAN